MKCQYCHHEITNIKDMFFHEQKKCIYDYKYDKHIYEMLREKIPPRCDTPFQPPLPPPVDPCYDLIECEICHKRYSKRGITKHRNNCLSKINK